MAEPSLKLSGFCKHCGFEFRSIRSHLIFSPKCTEKYETDNNPEKLGPGYNPEYILSGPCRSCGIVFKQIKSHLSKAPHCLSAYDMEELEEARKLKRRLKRKESNKEYYAANYDKIRDDCKMSYHNNHQFVREKFNKYYQENKERIHGVKKWKLENEEVK